MISITLLGIGAAEIVFGSRRIFIDAFNDIISEPDLGRGDLILFTHADGDHFNAEKTVAAAYPETLIAGPPSIVHPLWETDTITSKQVQVFYPSVESDPVQWKWGNISIKVFQTQHFIGWHPPHISFLFEYNDKRIFFSGDTALSQKYYPMLQNLDVLILSLIREEVTKENMPSHQGKYLLMNDILKLQHTLKPGKIIGNHLIDCTWTIPPRELNQLLKQDEIPDILIPEVPGEKITV